MCQCKCAKACETCTSFKPLVALQGPRRLIRADNGFEIYNLEREPVKPIGRLVCGQIKDGYEYDPDVIWAKVVLMGRYG